MKKLLSILLVCTTLISAVIITSSCSHRSKVALKEDKIERRFRLSKNPLADVLLKPQPRNPIVNRNTKLQIDSINKKLEKLNRRLKNDWFKGQNRPYKRILVGLKKEGYDLTNYVDKGCDRKELYIQLANEWNMEEVNKIKNIIMSSLFFEPKVSVSHLPDGKEVTSMIWAGSKYDAQVFQSGFDELIHLSFETK
jgi:hypothetical protein